MIPVRFSALTFIAVAGLALSACVAPPATGPASTSPSATDAGVHQETRQTARLAQDDPAPEPVPRRVLPQIEELLGMSRVDLVDALGRPDFQRRDFGSEILRFRAGACALDAYLYTAEQDRGWRVSHVETRDQDGKAVTPAACLDQLAQRPTS